MKRALMTPQERSWRSELASLISHQSFLRGYLSVRERVCGKSNCHCARGEKHRSLYLVCSQEGKPKQFCIPREREAEVREWVAHYQRLRELLERLSEHSWDQLRRKEP